MPYFFIRFFENTLLPSIIAAFLRGPNAGIPCAASASTMPRHSGSSGATMTKSTLFSAAQRTVHVRRLEGQAGRNLRDAAVAGRGVQRRHFRVFLDFQRDGVFASAAADDEYLHLASLTFLNAINGGTGAYA